MSYDSYLWLVAHGFYKKMLCFACLHCPFVDIGWTPQASEGLFAKTSVGNCRLNPLGIRSKMNHKFWSLFQHSFACLRMQFGNWFCDCAFVRYQDSRHQWVKIWKALVALSLTTKDFPKECFSKPSWAPEPQWNLLEKKAFKFIRVRLTWPNFVGDSCSGGDSQWGQPEGCFIWIWCLRGGYEYS